MTEYDLVIIGSGAAGQTAATTAVHHGAAGLGRYTTGNMNRASTAIHIAPMTNEVFIRASPLLPLQIIMVIFMGLYGGNWISRYSHDKSGMLVYQSNDWEGCRLTS